MNCTFIYTTPPPRRWYCSFCKRDKKLAPALTEASRIEVRQCPDCKNRSCVWLEFTPRIRRPVTATATGEQFLKRQPEAKV